MNNKKPGRGRSILAYLVIGVVVVLILTAYNSSSLKNSAQTYTEVEFSEFIQHLQNKEITSLTISQSSERYQAVLSDGSMIVAYAPTAYDMAIISEQYLYPQIEEGVITKIDTIQPGIMSMVISWLPTILLIAFMFFMWRSLMGGGGNKGMMNFGKSRAQMAKDGDHQITFKDVAGLKEEKQELAEIVDFLKNPKKYTELGARIPKGVLLVGPPGTGKTFISKAVAGEAGVPFFSISGSDFVEMFVGVGASRVRDLFDNAKKEAPCIVFIDEIDAVGRRRGAGIGGGNDEREQTLNQLLVEMDGFGVNEGIIILAATNRPDVLDPAILRPGRFDRQVTIGAPDVKGREEVFGLYAKNKPIDKDVDLSVLAKRTPGFTPADIENMMNEAALLTARRNGTIIHMDDLEEAITRVIAGPKKTTRVMSEKERKLTAYHEGGHAVISRCIPGYDPVHQVTIMPRGSAGGFTMNLPEEDSYYATKGDMINDIVVLLGGRVAEQLVLEDISTGASNDLERATRIAHDMVVKYGMTEAIGPVNYSDADEVFLGRDFTSKQNFSEELAAKIDKEVRRILDECYAKAVEILTEHRTELDRIASALLDVETLDKDEFEQIFTDSKSLDLIKEENAAADKIRKELEAKEAAARAEKEAEEAEKAKTEMMRGKRVAVIDAKGKPTIKTMEEFVKAEEAKEQESAKALEEAAEAPAQAPQAEENTTEESEKEEK